MSEVLAAIARRLAGYWGMRDPRKESATSAVLAAIARRLACDVRSVGCARAEVGGLLGNERPAERECDVRSVGGDRAEVGGQRFMWFYPRKERYLCNYMFLKHRKKTGKCAFGEFLNAVGRVVFEDVSPSDDEDDDDMSG